MEPDNKYCPECTTFEGETYDEVMEFREKYGFSGCSGIPHSSGEFPYKFHPHCFTDEKILTNDEIKADKIKAVLKIVQDKTPEEAAEYLVNHWDSL